MNKKVREMPGWPRGLSRELVSTYIGVSASLFDEMVRDGRMPAATQINRRRVWDIHAVDAAFTALSGIATDAWDRPPHEGEANFSPPKRPVVAKQTTTPNQKWCPPEYEKYRGEDWFEKMTFYKEGEWEALVKSEPLNKRELIGLEGYVEGKGQMKLEVRGCSINTIELLVVRGYLQVVSQRGEGKVPYYGITPAGEAAWNELAKIGPPSII